MAPPHPIDLSLAKLPEGKVSWEYSSDEHPEERAHRLRVLGRKALIEDVQGVVVFLVMLLVVLGLGGVSAYALIVAKTTDESEKKLALTALSALFSGALGFVVGRKIGSKPE